MDLFKNYILILLLIIASLPGCLSISIRGKREIPNDFVYFDTMIGQITEEIKVKVISEIYEICYPITVINLRSHVPA